MATSRPVRIPRSIPGRANALPFASVPPTDSPSEPRHAGSVERRPNVGGSQRALRVSVLYVVVLAVLYVGFVLYDRTAPGGTSSPSANGVLLLTVLFAVFGVGGVLYTLTPAPRAVEVGAASVTVVGRWGRRRSFPPLDQLSVRMVRRYPAGWLADTVVELAEVWGPDVPVRGYLVDQELFAGASTSDRER